MTTICPDLTIYGLADDVLLHIFSFLNVKDKCRAVQVCKRWDNLIHHKSVWKHIDLTPFKVDLKSIWKLVRAYFTDSLLSLHLHGFMESIKSTECISNAVLTQIENRCQNLRELHISKANLTTIDSSLLPGGLKRLTLHKCMLTVHWFLPAVKKNTLQNLELLNLEGSTRTDNDTLKDVAELKQLKSVNFNGCYRVGEPGIAVLAEKLKKIEELKLDECGVDDPCLHHIGRHLKDLKIISMKNCSGITDLGLGSLTSLKPEKINVSSENITVQGFNDFLVALVK